MEERVEREESCKLTCRKVSTTVAPVSRLHCDVNHSLLTSTQLYVENSLSFIDSAFSEFAK